MLQSKSLAVDFWRRIISGLLIAGLIWVIIPRINHLLETRWVRDLRGLTPFHDVVVSQVLATSYTLDVVLTAIKDKDCKAIGLPAVIIHQWSGPDLDNGAFQSLELASVPISRTASPYPRVFGPWRITSPIPWPKSVTLYRTHLGGECPKVQTNAVFTIPWQTSSKPQVQ